MPIIDSPLRYPGGKSQLAPLVIDLLRSNDLFYGEYIEPFAGGAGIACTLLLDGYVSHIHINDLDRSIYSFWWAILNEPERFCNVLIRSRSRLSNGDTRRRYKQRLILILLHLDFRRFS